MALNTGIEWTDATVNPVVGCCKVSIGCAHCYAERMAVRLAGNPRTPQYQDVVADGHWSGRTAFVPAALELLQKAPRPLRIFMVSMGDLFYDGVREDHQRAVLDAMLAEPRHTYQLLTKREHGMRDVLGRYLVSRGLKEVPPNWWVGVTCEDQAAWNSRVPVLLRIPAAVRWVSVEPMLGPVHGSTTGESPTAAWLRYDPLLGVTTPRHGGTASGGHPRLSWVVCGGETGQGARPVNPEWVVDLFRVCRASSVAWFAKKFPVGAEVESDARFAYACGTREFPEVAA
jgi:protein gp37